MAHIKLVGKTFVVHRKPVKDQLTYMPKIIMKTTKVIFCVGFVVYGTPRCINL